MISRTHFEAIAKTMAETKYLGAYSRAALMADTLAKFNPGFDRDRFIAAALGAKNRRSNSSTST